MARSYDLHSLVLASDYRVPDPHRMWSQIQARRDELTRIGAHHVVVYTSTQDPGRVLVTIGVRHKDPVTRLLNSPVILQWFDIAGVDDIPAVFAGEIVEKIEIIPSNWDMPPGIVVAGLAQVDDVGRVAAEVHDATARFRSAGVRKVWIYQALDDKREVMILQELESEAIAHRWIDEPDAAADWMHGAGFGAYPPLFVGALMDLMSLEDD